MLRIPQTPPPFGELLEAAFNSGRVNEVYAVSTRPTRTGRYDHWDKIRHLSPPDGLTHREWWLALKLRRAPITKEVPLRGTDGSPFTYVLADPILELLHGVDLRGGGTIGTPGPITNPETKDRYLIRSLIEEAAASSLLEGAATTRRVAREMIRTRRRPRDRGERMILNNFHTLQQIGRVRGERLTNELVCEIHRLVTAGTLDNPVMSGRFRSSDQKVDVSGVYNQVFHVPPSAQELHERVESFCAFANGETPRKFVHPVIRSVILHFWLAYDHPFVDGNGRTARALFYWSMLHHRYWLCEFISISEIILKAPSQYERAFLYTETDANDLTYFLIYHLDIIRRAFDQLNEHVTRKTQDLERLERELRGTRCLNHRQRALAGHALRHPRQDYTIQSHQTSHGVVYQTARTDLLDLAERGLLEAYKIGRAWHFRPMPDLRRRLAEL